MTADTSVVTQLTPRRPEAEVAERWHTVALLLILAMFAFLGYAGAPHGGAGGSTWRLGTYFTTAVFEWLVVLFIAWGVWRKGLRFRDILGNRWKSAGDVFRDMGIAVGFWILSLCVLGLIGYGLGVKQGQNVEFLFPRTRLEIVVWLLLASTAGFCEETIFRGYLQRQFLAWTSNPSAAVALSAIGFGAAHIYQGPKSAMLIAVYGAMYGGLAQFRGSLIPGMMTHAWQDSFAGIVGPYLLRVLRHAKPGM